MLNKSIVEDAALIMPGASLTPAFSQWEKESRQGKLAGLLREAIRRLNPAIPEEARGGVFKPLIDLSN